MKKYLYNIFLIFFFLFSCNSEAKETEGTIIGTIYNPLIGDKWSAKAYYEFFVDENKFIDTVYFNQNDLVLIEEQKVIIEFNNNNPKENKIKK